jgi:hypothetical protein
MDPVLMSIPAFTIVIGLEALRPQVRIDCINEAEWLRLVDWIHANPSLGTLLDEALELAGYEQAA